MAATIYTASSGKVMSRQVALMDQARTAATFNTFELTCFIHGDEENVKQRRAAFERVEKLLGTRDTTKLPRSYGNMNREEAYDEGLEEGKAAFEDMLNHNHRIFEHSGPRYILSNASPFGMNALMFEPTIRLMASDSQNRQWMSLSQTGKIIGAYCSTELGHGSFVRGMETTATFDPNTDEFVINSPSTSSGKFWPGAAGFSCTHAIITARLFIKGQDHGPHFFMMRFRSQEAGTPLPGITLGDVGLKMSYNGTCNGYAYFDNVRIPRFNMLSRHAQVSHDAVTFQLAQAVTIAARYSTVREQGLGPNGLGTTETAIISYKTQHFRILTLISSAYAILFAARASDATYKALRQQQNQGNHAMLLYAHSLMAGLKAWATQTAADGAEDAQKCCGGQGYLTISGLPEIVAAVTATATFEGENYVLWQQVGRVLFKIMDTVDQGKEIDPNMAYLASGIARFHADGSKYTSPPQEKTTSLDLEAQLDIYRHRAFYLVHSAWRTIRTSPKPPA